MRFDHKLHSVRSSIGAAVIAATVLGCGIVKLPGSNKTIGGGGGGGSPLASASDKPSGDPAAVLATYKQFTFESCSNFDCTGRFRKAAGVKETSDAGGYMMLYNPRAEGKNPDPVWLPGWDKLPTKASSNDADVVYQALVLGAAMRTWQARCHADYAALHQKLAADDKRMEDGIAAANAKPSTSARISALLALRTRTDERLDGLSFEDALAKIVGGRHTLELAILDAFRSSAHEYAYFLIPGIATQSAVIERGRPRADLATERENYCNAVLGGEPSRTPQPPQWGSNYLERGQVAVKPPIDRALVERFTATRKETYAGNAKTFMPTKSYSELQTPVQESGASKGALSHITTETVVKSAKRSGTKLVVELAGTHKNTAPYGCRQTGQLDADLRPALECKLRTITADQHAVITFADAPESVTIEPGMHLELFGTKQTQSEKTLVDKIDEKKLKEDWTFEGAYLVRAFK